MHPEETIMAKMSTIQIFDRQDHDPSNVDSLWMLSATRTKVVCEDPGSENRVIFEGENLVVERGMIVKGTVETMIITDPHGHPFSEYSGFAIDSRLIDQDTMLNFTIEIAVRVSTGNNKFIGSNHDDILDGGRRDDILLGRKGDDRLSGDAGTDVMTGGAGNDTFVFAKGDGKDTITDFDADGGTGAQDLIDAKFLDVVSTEKSGENTIIDFGNGDTLTLLHVQPSQIDASDFTM
jgi:hypothetical protein